MKRQIDIGLAVICFLSAVALFLSHEDPFARKIVCQYTGLCHAPISNAKAWYKISYDLNIGSLTSIAFYLLLVRLPEYERRRRLKQSFQKHYKSFREDCIATMLSVADGSYSLNIRDELMDRDKFRRYFSEKVTSSQTRWDQFANKLKEHSLNELLMHMEILREEIAFILNNTDVSNDEAFEFLKILSRIIYSMKSVTLEYDDVKKLGGFLWSVFTGWDWITGYHEEDVVTKMIADI